MAGPPGARPIRAPARAGETRPSRTFQVSRARASGAEQSNCEADAVPKATAASGPETGCESWPAAGTNPSEWPPAAARCQCAECRRRAAGARARSAEQLSGEADAVPKATAASGPETGCESWPAAGTNPSEWPSGPLPCCRAASLRCRPAWTARSARQCPISWRAAFPAAPGTA